MNRFSSGLLAVLSLCAAPALAQAQPRIGSYQKPQVNPNPTISPYLNLGRGPAGSGAATNYYTVVRPQLDMQGNVITLQQQFQNLRQAQQTTQAAETDALHLATGHSIGGFFSFSHYFPQLSKGSPSQRPPSAGSGGQR